MERAINGRCGSVSRERKGVWPSEQIKREQRFFPLSRPICTVRWSLESILSLWRYPIAFSENCVTSRWVGAWPRTGEQVSLLASIFLFGCLCSVLLWHTCSLCMCASTQNQGICKHILNRFHHSLIVPLLTPAIASFSPFSYSMSLRHDDLRTKGSRAS